MNYMTYKCLVTHTSGGKLYKRGFPYSFTSDPGARFEYFNNNSVNPAGVDLDGTWFPGMFGYDDFSFSLTQAKQGSNLLPPYDYTEMGIAFPQNDATEVVYLNQLTSHRMKAGADVIWYPHVHYIQDEAEIPVFEYRYRITPALEQVPDFSAWIPTTGVQEAVYESGKIQQIMVFPPLLVGDVVVKTFDFHAPFDAPLGSGQEYTK